MFENLSSSGSSESSSSSDSSSGSSSPSYRATDVEIDVVSYPIDSPCGKHILPSKTTSCWVQIGADKSRKRSVRMGKLNVFKGKDKPVQKQKHRVDEEILIPLVDGKIPRDWVLNLDFLYSSMTPDEVNAIIEFSYSTNTGFRVLRAVCRKPWEPPLGFLCLHEDYFRICGLWFPLLSLLIEYCKRRRIAISQLTPPTIRNMVGMLLIGATLGFDVDCDLFEAMTTIMTSKAFDGTFFATMRPNCAILSDKLSKVNDWKNYYFFVEINEASFLDVNADIRTSWSPILVRHDRYPKLSPENLANCQEFKSLELVSWSELLRKRRKWETLKILRATWRVLRRILFSFKVEIKEKGKVISASRNNAHTFHSSTPTSAAMIPCAPTFTEVDTSLSSILAITSQGTDVSASTKEVASRLPKETIRKSVEKVGEKSGRDLPSSSMPKKHRATTASDSPIHFDRSDKSPITLSTPKDHENVAYFNRCIRPNKDVLPHVENISEMNVDKSYSYHAFQIFAGNWLS